jgi:chromosome segregation ATPase
MKLESYLQIAILAILALLLWRDNRLEKRREAQKDRNLASSFNNLKDCLDSAFKSALSAIKAQIELTYSERYAWLSSALIELNNSIGALPSTQTIQAAQDSLQTKLLATLQALDNSLNSQLSTLNSQLQSIQTPIKLWGEAQTKHVINEGEANRTLRKKLQDQREYIANINSQLNTLSTKLNATRSELSEVKFEAASFMAALVAEVDFMRSWLDAKGMPLSALDKSLDMEFKAQVPSREYHKVQNEKNLRKHLDIDSSCEAPSPDLYTPLPHSCESRNLRPLPPDPSEEVANA